MKMGKLLAHLKDKVSLLTKKSLKRRDYNVYLWEKGELFVAILKSVGVVCALSYFFYKSIFAVLPLMFVGVFYFKDIMEKKKENCRELLVLQFKECILSVATSLKAGYAVENAFMESRLDMKLLYGENSLIYNELELIRRGMVVNITLEDLLEDLAVRSGSDDIRQFVHIFTIAKRNGGSLPEIITTSSELIGRRIETRQEIRTILSGRIMEQKIMQFIPFLILAYVGVSYSGYFDILYHNLKGILIMSGCLVVYLAAYIIGEKILKRIENEMM